MTCGFPPGKRGNKSGRKSGTVSFQTLPLPIQAARPAVGCRRLGRAPT